MREGGMLTGPVACSLTISCYLARVAPFEWLLVPLPLLLPSPILALAPAMRSAVKLLDSP